MRTETFSQTQSPWQNEAFSLEIKEPLKFKSFEELVISYLGEYRFQLPLYQYSYHFDRNQGLIDPNTQESMIVKAQRAIERKNKELKPILREEAELIGLKKINRLLTENLEIGAGIVWASPPGDKNDGYGDYGFIFYGVVDGIKNGQWHVTMNARRVEDGRDLEKFNQVLTALTGQSIHFKNDTDFLQNPMLLHRQIVNPEEIISQIFNPINEQTQAIFEQALGNNGVLKPLINEAVKAYLSGNYEEFVKLMTALENLSEELKNPQNRHFFIDDNNQPTPLLFDSRIINFYSSYQPPPVSGSCGSTSNSPNSFWTSGNFFEKLLKQDLMSQLDHYEDYQCPNCGQTIQGELKDKPETWKSCCPHCGYEFSCSKK